MDIQRPIGRALFLFTAAAFACSGSTTVALATAASQPTSVQYRVTDLGAAAPGRASYGIAIDDDGRILIANTDAMGAEPRGQLLEAGVTTDLSPGVAGGSVIPAALGDAGEVVGATTDAGNALHACRWLGGQPTLLSAPDTTSSTAATCVRGDLVAGVGKSTDDQLGFAWNAAGVMTLPPVAGDAGCRTNGINAAGIVVGSSGVSVNGAGRPVEWQNGTPQPLGLLPAAALGEATAIDDAGNIIGDCTSVSGTPTACRWVGGAAKPLSPAGGDSAAFALSSGQVVGEFMPSGQSLRHACSWSLALNGAPTDLNSLTNDSSWILVHANSINKRGAIVGWGYHGFGPPHAFLFEPIGPDISLQVTPASVTIVTENTVTLTLTATNQSPYSTTGAHLQFSSPFLVTAFHVSSGTADDDRFRRVVTTSTLPMEPGESRTLSVTVQVSGAGASSASGSVIADGDPYLTNNYRTIPFTILSPDLAGNWLQAAAVCPNPQKPRDCTVSGTLEVRNQGTAPSGATIVVLFLSKKVGVDRTAIYLGRANLPALDPGGKYQFSFQLPLPKKAKKPTGLRLLAAIDLIDVVEESNEANNTVASSVLN